MKLTKRKLKLLVKEELQKLYEDDDSCEPGTTFTADDGCNTCTCPKSGKKSEAKCTEKACGDESDFGKFNENTKLLQEKGQMYGKKTSDQIKAILDDENPGKLATVFRSAGFLGPVKYEITYEDQN